MSGKKQNINPTWKVRMKDVDLGEPTSFFWPCLFGLHSKTIWNKQRYCRQLQKCVWIQDLCWCYRKTTSFREIGCKYFSWSCDMEGHAKKCVERYCELANKTTQQLYKVATPRMDDHQFKEEENESVGELSTGLLTHFSQMFVFGPYWETYSTVGEQTCSC